MELSILIVNYNVKYFTSLCLQSVLKAVKNITAEILVADNNSTDNSLPYLSSSFPNITFIANKKNIGFSAANNQLARLATGKFLLFLNPDTVVPEDALEKCLSFMQSHPDAGALGVRMINSKGKFLRESRRAFPSPKVAFYKLSGLADVFPRSPVFAKYHLGHLPESATQKADILAGAFMLIRKETWEKTGGFDEAFFMYGEDIDLSWRIRQQGYNNYYFAGVTVLHFKGESTAKGSLDYVKMFYKAMSIFAQKHIHSGKAVLYNYILEAAIRLRAGISAIATLFRKKNKPLKKTILIIGNEEDRKNISSLLNANGTAIKLVEPDFSNDDPIIDTHVNKIINAQKIDEVIISTQLLSYGQALDLISSGNKKTAYLFYLPKNKTIVGSGKQYG